MSEEYYETEVYKTTSDIVILHEDDLYNYHIVLVQRGIEPYKGMWALPGGHLNVGETFIDTAVRELREETKIILVPEDLSIFHILDDPDRDPRGRVISPVYVHMGVKYDLKAGDYADKCEYFSLMDVPELAFDHQIIIDKLVERFVS